MALQAHVAVVIENATAQAGDCRGRKRVQQQQQAWGRGGGAVRRSPGRCSTNDHAPHAACSAPPHCTFPWTPALPCPRPHSCMGSSGWAARGSGRSGGSCPRGRRTRPSRWAPCRRRLQAGGKQESGRACTESIRPRALQLGLLAFRRRLYIIVRMTPNGWCARRTGVP